MTQVAPTPEDRAEAFARLLMAMEEAARVGINLVDAARLAEVVRRRWPFTDQIDRVIIRNGLDRSAVERAAAAVERASSGPVFIDPAAALSLPPRNTLVASSAFDLPWFGRVATMLQRRGLPCSNEPRPRGAMLVLGPPGEDEEPLVEWRSLVAGGGGFYTEDLARLVAACGPRAAGSNDEGVWLRRLATA